MNDSFDDGTGTRCPIFKFDYDENEYNKKIKDNKDKITDFVNKLNSTIDLNEEISFGNKLKWSIESLLNLLESKKFAKQKKEEQEEEEKKEIKIIFRNGQYISVKCLRSEKISNIIEKYRNLSNDHDPNKSFLYNCKCLIPTLTVFEEGIKNNDCIFVINHNKNNK